MGPFCVGPGYLSPGCGLGFGGGDPARDVGGCLFLMKIKAQRIRDARAFTTYIGNSILIMENSDLGGCETLETPNIFLFLSVLSLLLF